MVVNLRVVPLNPDPREFPARNPQFACDLLPALCRDCYMPECPRNVPRAIRGGGLEALDDAITPEPQGAA